MKNEVEGDTRHQKVHIDDWSQRIATTKLLLVVY